MADKYNVLADELVRSVELLADTLAKKSIKYALVGGLAALLRGRPRFTQDVDFLIDVPQLALPGLLEELEQQNFQLDMITVIREYVQQHMTAFRYGAVRIDWLKPVLPLYARTIADATSEIWTEGHTIRVAKPEGLILTKMLSFRPQDKVDIEVSFATNGRKYQKTKMNGTLGLKMHLQDLPKYLLIPSPLLSSSHTPTPPPRPSAKQA